MGRILESAEKRFFRKRTIRDVRGGARDTAEDAIFREARTAPYAAALRRCHDSVQSALQLISGQQNVRSEF
jgi:hypothetical protein